MRVRSRSASLVAGIGIALGVGIPTAQATEVFTEHSMLPTHSTASTHISKQALGALEARWNAQVAYYKLQQAKANGGTLGPYLGRH
jgi:hypothetical protein